MAQHDPLQAPIASDGDQKTSCHQAGKDALEFAWKVHGYTNEYIRFADAKAGVVMTWCAALVGALFAAKAHHYFLVQPSMKWAWRPTLLGAGSVIAFSLLAASILYGVGVIMPRLRPKPEANMPAKSWWTLATDWLKDQWKRIQDWWSPPNPAPSAPSVSTGLIFWDQVQANGDEDGYWAMLSGKQSDSLARAVTDHTFVLAQIASEKYRCVKRSIWYACWGSVVAGVMAIATASWPP